MEGDVDMSSDPRDGDDSVLLQRDDAVLTITLNRPHRKNALNPSMWSAFEEALARVRHDDEIQAVVITGSGGDFSAGADLGNDERDRHPLNSMSWINDIATALYELPKPVIAQIDGVAVGAGWNLALACDLVVATPQARFSQIFTQRGLSPDFGGSWLLPRMVGPQQAKRLAFLAEFIDASEASELGLVTWVRESGEIDVFVAGLAHRLAAGPPIALAQTKALLNHGVDRSFRQALEAEGAAQTVNFGTRDTVAAFDAFRTKSESEFTGEWMN